MTNQFIENPGPAVVDLPFEPAPQFRPILQDDAAIAGNAGKRIGILVVTYNAVTTLTKVLKRITPNVWRNVEEVVVFDDASQDATFELAVGIKMLTNLPKLRVLKHSKNLGYGGNQKAGYRYFIENGFDIVVLLHGDGQYAPEILAHMYGPLVRGEAEAVFGSRMMKTYGGPLKGGMPLYKYLGNRMLTAFENKALGLNLTEFHSGYRAYNLHALNEINFEHMTDEFHFDTEIIIKLNHQNFKIQETPIPTFYGDELCYVNGMRYAKDVARAVRRYISTVSSVRSYPEFEEYFVPCPVKQSKYSSHHYTRKLVGAGQRVLEFGSGNGAFADELARSGNQVAVIARRPIPACENADAHFEINLESGLEQTFEELSNRRFSRIALLDVLEHLKDGSAVMSDCARLLDEKGIVIVCVPNFANLTVRLMTLFGSFHYAERGILDWEHVRFFTRKTIREFLRARGYEVLKEHNTVIPIERLWPMRPENMVFRLLNRAVGAITRLCPGLFAYEFVIAARPLGR